MAQVESVAIQGSVVGVRVEAGPEAVAVVAALASGPVLASASALASGPVLASASV